MRVCVCIRIDLNMRIAQNILSIVYRLGVCEHVHK